MREKGKSKEKREGRRECGQDGTGIYCGMLSSGRIGGAEVWMEETWEGRGRKEEGGRIEENKLDNLVHIAHNVIIGEQGFLTAQVGIAGSTVVGKNVVLGGQSGIVGHINVGDNVTLGAKSAIISNTKGNQTLSGYPAIDHKQELKNKIAMKKLPELIKRVKKLEGSIK